MTQKIYQISASGEMSMTTRQWTSVAANLQRQRSRRAKMEDTEGRTLEKMTGKGQANCLLFHNWSQEKPGPHLIRCPRPLSAFLPPFATHFSVFQPPKVAKEHWKALHRWCPIARWIIVHQFFQLHFLAHNNNDYATEWKTCIYHSGLGFKWEINWAGCGNLD